MTIASSKFTIKSSGIHGTGLFATDLIRKGELIVSWKDTKEITPDEFSKLPEAEKHYIDIQNGKIFLVGKPERYLNHSCNANTVPGELCDMAARDILLGEEITADYSHFFIPGGSFQCFCRSPSCRGLVTGSSFSAGSIYE